LEPLVYGISIKKIEKKSTAGEIICQFSPACKNLGQELKHLNNEMQKKEKKKIE
jgi:hypothetical protein